MPEEILAFSCKLSQGFDKLPVIGGDDPQPWVI